MLIRCGDVGQSEQGQNLTGLRDRLTFDGLDVRFEDLHVLLRLFFILNDRNQSAPWFVTEQRHLLDRNANDR